MARSSETISLGGRQWIIRPLTCLQVEQIEPFVHMAHAGNGLAMARKTIEIAVGRDYPADVAALAELETDRKELDAAGRIILIMGGWLDPKETGDQPAGEAEAPRTGAEPGPGSEAA